ncbi:hypothetical protein EII17_04135 [Clostridiales bacterium COT073_COT-073]|nr:hypothetical protein EII17_04135 [Clostridiales bacterium COT073_COT-073]
MILINVEEKDKWLISRWALTYRVGWEQILKAFAFGASDYSNFEILVDNQIVSVKSKEDYSKLEEAGSLSFRGISAILKVPVMITFYNQTDIASVSVAMANEEFSKADYEKFNKSLGQYLNSIELAMYR